jgi:hypothetical protein
MVFRRPPKKQRARFYNCPKWLAHNEYTSSSEEENARGAARKKRKREKKGPREDSGSDAEGSSDAIEKPMRYAMVPSLPSGRGQADLAAAAAPNLDDDGGLESDAQSDLMESAKKSNR